MSSDGHRAAPVIPLLVFAAIDIVLAFLLLLAGGFSLQFWVVAAIGIGLAFLGLRAVVLRRLAGGEEPS